MLKSSLQNSLKLFAKKGSLIKLITAGMLMLFVFTAPMLVGIYGASLLRLKGFAAEGFKYGTVAILGLLLTMPCTAMLMTYTRQVYESAKYGYCEKRKGAFNYFRSIRGGYMLFSRLLLPMVLLQISYVAAELCNKYIRTDELAIPFLVLVLPLMLISLLISVIWLWITHRTFAAPYYYFLGRAPRMAKKESRRVTKAHPFRADIFSLCFVGMGIPSLVTFGVGFVLFVQPLMIFTYFEFADKAYCKD